ncbi:oocyte zinc finger protein XlCOF6.1-like [Ischnura elegans]|uniref:oocyte zinc finger protein XlCOF6.1-like n=1 Tax=Ischnura elegans TaxID=197161 RepID=UPI001ED897E0|nr:oocyte zinc finger protein XlCOF6.1-like [Ischnura elegans]XP_046393915.1 oocyte zinc finger protein XlCOF6.1-like [Ischnura elegans]XP_046393916.1 oocyte zinc finger protein XlCOF6.1-like [Ischnura elegans]
MREERRDYPGGNQIDIDLSIVKEEVLSIEDLHEFPWTETFNQEELRVKKEEDKEQPETREESFEQPTKHRRVAQRRRKGSKRKVVHAAVQKPKHWCSICNCKHESAHALALHRLECHPHAARHHCAYCPRIFFHHSNRRKHELAFHLGPRPRLPCTLCTKTFVRKDGLMAHVRSAHTGERPYVCKQCGASFARLFCFRTHLHSHSERGPYACNQCTRTFNGKSDLVRHLRLHSGEKPFSCERCGMTFRIRGQLNRHLSVHTGKRELACGLCPKTFPLGTNIARHRAGHIVEAAMLKRHKCEVCKRLFSRKTNLREHMKRHSVAKRAKCHHCCRAFRTNSDLAKHVNVHTREKLYICDACGKEFLRKGGVRRHIHAFHLLPRRRKWTTVCLACGQDYFFPSRLKIHQKNKRCTAFLRQLKQGK